MEAYLDVVSLVIVTTLPKESVGNNLMDVKFIQHRIGILIKAVLIPAF